MDLNAGNSVVNWKMRSPAEEGLAIHRAEELFVGEGVTDAFVYEVHGFEAAHVGHELAEDVHAVERGLVLQKVIATRGALDEIDGREEALVGQTAVKLQLHVACALELFENHLVHLRTGVDEGGGDDGE